MILILTTFTDKKRAHDLGKKLLQKKLIACYNLVPVEAAYWWKGKIVDENEILMIIKTNKKFDDIEKLITKNHSYNTPEIVGIETKLVNQKYLKWLENISG